MPRWATQCPSRLGSMLAGIEKELLVKVDWGCPLALIEDEGRLA